MALPVHSVVQHRRLKNAITDGPLRFPSRQAAKMPANGLKCRQTIHDFRTSSASSPSAFKIDVSEQRQRSRGLYTYYLLRLKCSYPNVLSLLRRPRCGRRVEAHRRHTVGMASSVQAFGQCRSKPDGSALLRGYGATACTLDSQACQRRGSANSRTVAAEAGRNHQLWMRHWPMLGTLEAMRQCVVGVLQPDGRPCLRQQRQHHSDMNISV